MIDNPQALDLKTAVLAMVDTATAGATNPNAPKDARDFDAGRRDAYLHVADLIDLHFHR